jgi:beta-lactamase superfamily II metal-dependent hydrolase
LPGPLPEQVGVTTAASISTAPVSILTFGSASLVSVPANAVGGFVLGPIMFLGMLSLLLGFVSEWASLPLNVAAGLFIGFLLAVARFFAGLPGAVYVYQGVTLRLVLVVGLLAGLAVVAALAAGAGGGGVAYVRDRRRRPPLVAATAALLAAALLLSPAPVRPPDRPTLTFLDVGEGAASLLQAPGGPTVLIDAGPSPLAATLRRHGVRRIDLLVLSHGHADHVGGLADVVGSIPIGTALLPDPEQRSAALDRIEQSLRAAGTVVRRVTAEQAASGEGWSLRLLPTRPLAGEEGNQSENDCALVALVGLSGHEALVPGDAEGEVLQEFALPRCDVVELPHHGSRGGLSASLLAQLQPRLGVISVGPNTYGHPTAEMLDLLAGAGVPCARTDQVGEVAVWADARGLEVSTAVGRRITATAVGRRITAAAVGRRVTAAAMATSCACAPWPPAAAPPAGAPWRPAGAPSSPAAAAHSSLRRNDQAAAARKASASSRVTVTGRPNATRVPLSRASLAARSPAGVHCRSAGNPVSAKSVAYTASPAPAAAACLSMAAESQSIRHTNMAASASHTATDATNCAMWAASKSAMVTTTQSAAPITVATSTMTRLATAFDQTNAVRDSGLVSTSTAVPLRRSPATAAAPVMMTTSNASCARLPMNCP